MLGEADMGLMDQCETLYKTSNPYDVIGVTKDASEADVRQVIIKSHYKSTLI
jgi:preprotein translocase subunit Sec63